MELGQASDSVISSKKLLLLNVPFTTEWNGTERNGMKLNGVERNGLVVFTLHYGTVLYGQDGFFG